MNASWNTKKEKLDVAAIAVSDLHLSLHPPLIRSVEDNWLKVQRRYLNQLRKVVDQYQCPLIYAGDIFDKPNAPSELINFVLKYLPRGYAIPGQHDLLYHSYKDIQKTAFHTLELAGILTEIVPGCPLGIGHLELHGFPWGTEVVPNQSPQLDLCLKVAVIHRYCWIKGKGYSGVLDEFRLRNLPLKGYDAAFIGDNHTPWRGRLGDCAVINTGTFMRRKADEILHRPAIGLLLNDGTIRKHYLNIDADKFLDGGLVEVVKACNLEVFVEKLAGMQITGIDFRDMVKAFLQEKKVSQQVQSIILAAMEE